MQNQPAGTVTVTRGKTCAELHCPDDMTLAGIEAELRTAEYELEIATGALMAATAKVALNVRRMREIREAA